MTCVIGRKVWKYVDSRQRYNTEQNFSFYLPLQYYQNSEQTRNESANIFMRKRLFRKLWVRG